jgi:hypothetical protein
VLKGAEFLAVVTTPDEDHRSSLREALDAATYPSVREALDAIK